jgi:hypothetical protein
MGSDQYSIAPPRSVSDRYDPATAATPPRNKIQGQPRALWIRSYRQHGVNDIPVLRVWDAWFPLSHGGQYSQSFDIQSPVMPISDKLLGP